MLFIFKGGNGCLLLCCPSTGGPMPQPPPPLPLPPPPPPIPIQPYPQPNFPPPNTQPCTIMCCSPLPTMPQMPQPQFQYQPPPPMFPQPTFGGGMFNSFAQPAHPTSGQCCCCCCNPQQHPMQRSHGQPYPFAPNSQQMRQQPLFSSAPSSPALVLNICCYTKPVQQPYQQAFNPSPQQFPHQFPHQPQHQNPNIGPTTPCSDCCCCCCCPGAGNVPDGGFQPEQPSQPQPPPPIAPIVAPPPTTQHQGMHRLNI